MEDSHSRKWCGDIKAISKRRSAILYIFRSCWLLRSVSPQQFITVANAIDATKGLVKNTLIEAVQYFLFADSRFLLLRFSDRGISSGVIAGISIALFIAGCIYTGIFRRKEVNDASLVPTGTEDFSTQPGNGLGSAFNKNIEALSLAGGTSPGLTGIIVDKSVEFSYEELTKATNDFSLDNKIGQGGFGTIFYAKLRGEKAAIKKMDMQASKEFLAELKDLLLCLRKFSISLNQKKTSKTN